MNKTEEKISIEFSGKDFDLIMQYMEYYKAKTVQDAILNAVCRTILEMDSATD